MEPGGVPQVAGADSPLSLKLGRAGAWLFFLGLLTGAYAGAALTGVVTLPQPHGPRLALASHLNGILGGLWLCAIAWSVPRLRYGEKGLRRLAFAATLSTYGNWIITILASALGRTGVAFSSDAKNNLVAVLLYSFVVLPGLAAAGAWALGFTRRSSR